MMFIETLKRFTQCQGKKVGNIVHIGAGDCDELDFYEMQNPDQIILVDADASVCKRLKEQTDGMGNCRVIQMAVTRKESNFTLHQYNNIKLNSNLSPKELEKNFPGIQLIASSQIQSVSLDSFLDGIDLVSNTSKISVLVFDNCGMNSELLADNSCQGLKEFDYMIFRSLRIGKGYGSYLNVENAFELIQLNETGLFFEFVYSQNPFYFQLSEQSIVLEQLNKNLQEESRRAKLGQKMLAKAHLDLNQLRASYSEKIKSEKELVELVLELKNKLICASGYYLELQNEHPKLMKSIVDSEGK